MDPTGVLHAGSGHAVEQAGALCSGLGIDETGTGPTHVTGTPRNLLVRAGESGVMPAGILARELRG